MPDKTATHNGLTCLFKERTHRYTLRGTGRVLTSVTTVVKRVTPPFDAPVMAQQMVDKQKPQYKNMTAIEILQQWRDKAVLSSSEGTAVHSFCEQWPETKGQGFQAKTHRIFLLTQQVNQFFPKLLKRFRVVEAEKLVFSPRLGTAGQIDLLMADDIAGEGIIIDWKTNGKITNEGGAFGTMLEPVEHLKHCDVVKYGLQLGLYEKILTDENYYPEFAGYRKVLIHVQPTFGRVIKVKNYAKEIIKCLMSLEN